MTSLKPSYIPAPNWDSPADGITIALGQIIKNPEDPESRIQNNTNDTNPPCDIIRGEKTDWVTTMENLRSGKIGIWAKCAAFIHLGGKLSFSGLKSVMEEHKFDTLETIYIRPDDDYLQAALARPAVQTYLAARGWRKPVYMITGLKFARGASVSAEINRENAVNAEIEAGPSAAGVPVTVGPGASWTSRNKKGITYAGSTDYLFAYQLMRLKSKESGQFSSEKYVKGALFGAGDGCDVVQRSLRDIYDIEYYEEEGLCIPDSVEEVMLEDAS